MKTYTNPVYPYTRPPELDAPGRQRPVVVVGAGPVGLAAAIDFGQRGIPVVVLDDDRTVSVGSRAICYAKRALEILDRLGAASVSSTRASAGTSARSSSATSSSTASTCCPSRATGARRSSTCSSTGSRSTWSIARGELDNVELRWENKVVGVDAARGPGRGEGRHARRRIRARLRLARRSATARAARCARCSASRRKGRSSATAS